MLALLYQRDTLWNAPGTNNLRKSLLYMGLKISSKQKSREAIKKYCIYSSFMLFSVVSISVHGSVVHPQGDVQVSVLLCISK